MSLKELDRKSREAFLEAAQFIAGADRLISDEENERLAFFRAETGLPETEFKPEGNGDSLDRALAVLSGLPKEQRALVFDELEGLAKCDRDYNSSERIVINAIRDVLNID